LIAAHQLVENWLSVPRCQKRWTALLYRYKLLWPFWLYPWVGLNIHSKLNFYSKFYGINLRKCMMCCFYLRACVTGCLRNSLGYGGGYSKVCYINSIMCSHRWDFRSSSDNVFANANNRQRWLLWCIIFTIGTYLLHCVLATAVILDVCLQFAVQVNCFFDWFWASDWCVLLHRPQLWGPRRSSS